MQMPGTHHGKPKAHLYRAWLERRPRKKTWPPLPGQYEGPL